MSFEVWMLADAVAMLRETEAANSALPALKDLGFREVAPANATSQPFVAITPVGGAVMPYRCVATTLAGFIQQLAVAYVTNGYWFYVTGRIPDGKDLAQIDQKIIDQYCIDVSKWTRARRKKLGLANVQYLRYGRFFVIMASRGEHPFFAREGKQIRDIRRNPLCFSGYSIGCRRGRGGGRLHASVRIQQRVYRQLKENFVARALQPSAEEIARDLHGLDYEPYAPIRSQWCGVLRAINRRRKEAGLELVPWHALRQRRSPVRPFD